MLRGCVYKGAQGLPLPLLAREVSPPKPAHCPWLSFWAWLCCCIQLLAHLMLLRLPSTGLATLPPPFRRTRLSLSPSTAAFCSKKYFIENIVEGKVVSRKKGFTSTACVNALDSDKETPELQGVPAGLKVVIIGEPLCSKCEGQSREETCFPACKVACTQAIARHLADVTKETGYVLDSKDNSKVVISCSNQCTNECLKPGKTSSFIYPFRPSR